MFMRILCNQPTHTHSQSVDPGRLKLLRDVRNGETHEEVHDDDGHHYEKGHKHNLSGIVVPK